MSTAISHPECAHQILSSVGTPIVHPIRGMSEYKDTNITVKFSKGNIDFVKPKLSSEPDVDETKEIIRYKTEEKQKTLHEQLRINDEIKAQEFHDRFKPKGPKALDEEDAAFLEERRLKQLHLENQTQQVIQTDLAKYDQQVKELTEIPKEDLEKRQKMIFKQATFSKKRKDIDEQLNLDLDVTVTAKPLKKEKIEIPKTSGPKKKSLVDYNLYDEE